ncbi:MAG: methyltransferase domain-containing protein [Acidobacteria bacterium]|nr:methyltransferase domain-containing protein [Acidobacteriota bacterium]
MLLENTENQVTNMENEVIRRYADGAKALEKDLCCPINYDNKYLDLLPQEIIEKDYGCGDPSIYVQEGETVLDLGSGAGKLCYIMSQKVGINGQVIGVDFNPEMLNLAHKYKKEIASKIGYDNVRFVKGKIQDLALDLEQVENLLLTQPITDLSKLSEFEAMCQKMRTAQPLIASDSVDLVVSNCVLNLVRPQDKEQLFKEIFRVLKRGGRAVISDIVSDEDPTEEILNDPTLWSGCIAGAFREDKFLEMFEKAGFYGVEILIRQNNAWQVINGIEFRSVTVRAFKGKEGACLERYQALTYKGPWKSVRDDDGHTFYRGQRIAVCDKTYQIMTNPNSPYKNHIIAIEPKELIPLEQAPPFSCKGTSLRHPKETKGLEYKETILAEGVACDCGPEGC